MLGIFCATKVMSNEDYRKYVRRRCLIYAGMAVIGVITAAVTMAAEFLWTVEISDTMLGMYTGVGVGLTAAGIILAVKSAVLLKNDQRLRQARIADSDERNIQIAAMATKAALAVLLVGIYFVILIGGLWYPVLVKVLTFLVVLFLFSYVAAYRIISRRV